VKIPVFPHGDTYTGDDGREHSVPEEQFDGPLTAIPTVDESHQAGATTPDRAGYRTVSFAGAAADQPQLLLPYDANRLEGYIVVQAAASNPVTAQALIAAGGGTGTATLPAGASIAGFDVTVNTPTASSGATITVTGAQGGTLTYYATGEGTAVEAVPVRFPTPLAPAAAGTPIAVTVVAGASQGQVAVMAYGSGAPLAAGVVYIGKQNQVDNASAKPGCALPPGTYPYRAKESVWVISDQAHASTVSFYATGWNN
jgi:hypothetical protein